MLREVGYQDADDDEEGKGESGNIWGREIGAVGGWHYSDLLEVWLEGG